MKTVILTLFLLTMKVHAGLEYHESKYKYEYAIIPVNSLVISDEKSPLLNGAQHVTPIMVGVASWKSTPSRGMVCQHSGKEKHYYSDSVPQIWGEASYINLVHYRSSGLDIFL